MINRVIDFSVKHKLLVLAVITVACLFGWRAMMSLPLDATPDLSETQVIIYSRWDRSPDIIEDQVTYPIVTAMTGAPKVKTVRGLSDFGYSYVYVVFEDGTDIYWARSRALEYLSGVRSHLPEGVQTEIGPDATALGWVYQYALVDTSGKHSLADLRSYQDWYLRYYLRAVQGVAEVAPVGGYSKQYQVNVDPNRLQAYGIPIRRVVEAVRSGNQEVGGRLLEFGGTEYMVRGRGYAKSIEEFGNIVLDASPDGTPIRIRDIGQVVEGPDLRRGVADLDGKGEVVSGIVIMRNGENALSVIDRVKHRIAEISPSLPEGVKIVPIYDRSELIHRAINNVNTTIFEVVVTVALIILIFLWHFPSAAIPILTMPIVVLLSFIPFRLMGISANIMSLAGVAIAFSELVDASIVVAEQAHKKLEQWERGGRRGDYRAVIIAAVKEVAGPTFFALLVIAISFLPVLTLEAQEGRMFKPLAYTKTLAMLIAAAMAITLDPALRLLLTRVEPLSFRPEWLCRFVNTLLVGKIRSEEDHFLSSRMTRAYEPVVRWTLRWKWAVIGGAAAMVVLSIPIFLSLGSEFMPPLDEGAILYMPSTMPGISITQAQALLQDTDRILARFPEVDRILGKAGRAETSTDPAPLSMFETVIIFKPRSEWRHVDTWYSSWAPDSVRDVLRHITPDTISSEELVHLMDQSLKVPGLSNAWTMPIKGRIDMLTTGMRTPVGLKVSGADLASIETIGTQIEKLLPQVKGTRGVFAERTGTGYFLDFDWKRDQLARYGLSVEDAQTAVENAIGGENVTTAVVGRERYPVNVRYMRDFRSDLGALERVLVPAGGQRQIPLGELAEIHTTSGPSMIRDEDGLLTGYVYVDVANRDPESYVNEAAVLLRDRVKLPAGYAITWSGQYEAMERVKHRLTQVVPLTLAIVCLLLFLNTRSLTKTMIVLLAVPFSAVGAVLFLYLAGYNISVGVWVGLIALMGIDAETGVYMLLYLDLAYDEARRDGRMRTVADLGEAIVHGAAKRLRPKFMTFATMFIGLLPIMWSTGTGADVMKRIAAPMVGGILASFVLELLVYPAIYAVWRQRSLQSGPEDVFSRKGSSGVSDEVHELVTLRLQRSGD
ncbi:MAG TPA: CusA/CzcA family heavy metal efflux RND transporter [Candidatus Sulfotelmatobacter sp.]|nr:CusA/CzcA family heavy metal efflux RND transporter [Candidatus Sulfotelmatobacter sp.]